MMTLADFTYQEGADGKYHLILTGAYKIEMLGDVSARLDELNLDIAHIDLSDVEDMDTIGAWVIYRQSRDRQVQIVNACEQDAKLIEAVGNSDQPAEIVPDKLSPPLRIAAEAGEAVIRAFDSLKGMVAFFGAIVLTIMRQIRHPSLVRVKATVRQFELVGVSALGIIGLMSFLIGVVVAQQGAVQLKQFGADVYTVNLVGRITMRELGVLMTAIMVAGRSGSAFAAQIGTMQLTEEVDAMRTIGVSPMEALVLPRVTALVFMMPLLGFYASMMSLIGGGLLCWILLEIPPITYVQRLNEVIPDYDLFVGMLKAPVFGMIIAITGCYQGMQVRGSAEAVGIRTTAAVVQAIFMVIVLDAFFAIFFSAIGWG